MSRPLKFLHVADLHLGATPYHHEERSKDFFRALHHVVVRYGVEEGVDFVVIAGDLFDKRNIEPRVLTQATVVFKELKEAGIPVFAIEGNHDRSGHASQVTWLRYLSDWGWFRLLEPEHQEDGSIVLNPWSDEEHHGGYLDFKGVRIVGSRWYGATTAAVIKPLADAIARLPGDPYTLLMFHTGLDGYLDHYSGGVTHHQLKPFKEAGVHYLALGHIHKRYEESGWIYNPGSLEAANVGEYREERGAYLVEIDPEARTHVATHITDYPSRPFHRLKLDVSPFASPEETMEAIEAHLRREWPRCKPKWPTDETVAKPVVELTLHGTLGFKRHELDLDAVAQLIVAHCDPLLPRVKYDAIPAEYAVAPGAAIGMDRKELERQVVKDLVSRDARYQPRAEAYGQVVLSLKQQAIAGAPPAEIASYLTRALSELG
ncbi:MAG TPA: exonuclease SbcCD subunit D [Pantanalinema sp.]